MKRYIDFTDCPRCEKPVMPLREALMVMPVAQDLSRPQVSCQSCRVMLEPSNVTVFSFALACAGGLVVAAISMLTFPEGPHSTFAQSLCWSGMMGGLSSMLLLTPGLFKKGFRHPKLRLVKNGS